MVAGFVVSPHDGDSVVSSPNPLALESEAKNLSSDSCDDDLSDGGPAEELNLLAMSDFHQFEGYTGFFYNTDPECHQSYGLDP